jgi:hypothetical protein
MIFKASEFKFPDTMRVKFPLIVRASPPEGWPRGTVVVSENKVPYRCFLQIIGASPASEFEAEIGEYHDDDPRITLSMLEEIALNCPLREDEAAGIKKEYETASSKADEKRPPLFVQGLISPIFCAFEAGMLSFSSALVLSLYTNPEVQWEIAGLGLLDKSPEAALKVFTDPFFPGDVLNQVAREPKKLRAIGYENFKYFLNEHSLFRTAEVDSSCAWPRQFPQKTEQGLPAITASFFLSVGKARREALFRGQRISVDGREFDFKELIGKSDRNTKTHSKGKRRKRWR